MNYDIIFIDTEKKFDVTKTKYTVSSSGFYFTHFSAGVSPYGKLNYTLFNTRSNPNIQLTHSAIDGQLVTSRDDLQYIHENQDLLMMSDYPLYSDELHQTTWSGFNLEQLMHPLVVFRAARTSSFVSDGYYVPLDQLLVNVGGVWDECNSYLKIADPGVYYLSWSSASVPNFSHQIFLHINGVIHGQTTIWGSLYNGTDVSSQSLMLPLNEGDTVQLYIKTGITFSNVNYQTSFVGFLYEPVNGQKIAWSLTFSLGINTTLIGPTNVRFTTILLNEGEAWNDSSGILSIPTAGSYYLKLSGMAYPNAPALNLVLHVNGKPIINVMEISNSSRNQYVNVRSRAVIINLKQGDQLIVHIPAGYGANSFYNDITFVGFLVNPNEASFDEMSLEGNIRNEYC